MAAVNNMSSMLMVMAVVVVWTASTATAASGVATFYEQYTRKTRYQELSLFMTHKNSEKPYV